MRRPDPKLLRSEVLSQISVKMVRVLRVFAGAGEILTDAGHGHLALERDNIARGVIEKGFTCAILSDARMTCVCLNAIV